MAKLIFEHNDEEIDLPDNSPIADARVSLKLKKAKKISQNRLKRKKIFSEKELQKSALPANAALNAEQ
jgi:hypothetical protein